MVFEFGGKIAVTKDALVPKFFKTENTLRSTIQRAQQRGYGLKKLMIGGNGRQLLIDFDSLPMEIKEQLPDPRKCEHIMERFYKTDADAVRFFSTYQFDDGTYLSQEHQEQYITNASMLKSAIALREARIKERRSKRGSIVGIAQTICSDVESFNKVLLKKHHVEHNLPSSLPRFKAALKAFENGGNFNYSSLISAKHKNQNSRKVDERTETLLNALFADKQRKPSPTEVHREYEAFLSGYRQIIDNETGEFYDPKEFKKLSDATVKAYLIKWENKIATYAVRSGNRQQLMGKFKPYHSLKRPKFANSIISIDDRQPPFKALNGKRVWFYMGIDLASQAFTCWVYGETKEGIITEFYRQMVRNYSEWGFNLPLELEAEMSLNSSFVNTFLKEGAMFEHVRIEANNARGKRIERDFRTMRYEYEKELEGWIPRPHASLESNQPGIDTTKIPQLPYEDIIDNSENKIEEWNNKPHVANKNLSRWEYFCQMQNPDTKPINWFAFLPHIGYRTETSVNVGIIRLQGKEFLLGDNGKIATGETLVNLMKRVDGEDVDVYWLDGNDGEILKALVFIGSQPVCEAIAKPTYNRATAERTAEDLENRALMSAYVATIESFGRKQKQAIAEITVLKNEPAPRQTFTIRNKRQRTVADGNDMNVAIMPSVEFDEPTPTTYETFEQSLEDRF
ncbi:hypothetical protein Pedsa_0977 [Pseudopedobacter saltans DSM 12145]|uniref:Integrase catalytic domain-containing protein n=1 Tax=Pseudopedobacter saltans (strain ATCC 51119 / DSM 12145 / JCM 21818 / CCUG 39354 / LMG 10337 / NBRC 100064 / NCIMB 13643) TaxID=762903 RepID=F0SAV3_PSESL|nr:hypothetical protein [Pseudopedobacter saltans]ADY51548.1 hypothetical protein Pedsa_0977 [Pseudopedobacter saltans DSM 12145]